MGTMCVCGGVGTCSTDVCVRVTVGVKKKFPFCSIPFLYILNGTEQLSRSVSSVPFRSTKKNAICTFAIALAAAFFYGVKSALKGKGICNLQRQYMRETFASEPVRCGVRKREGPPSSRRRAPRRCAALQV